MTDIPIIFSGPMVRVMLDGRKTMTRRVVTSPLRKCKAGDRLWVRESCADEHPLAVQEGRYSQEGRAGIPGPPGVTYRTVYRADGEPLQVWRNSTGEHPYFTLTVPADDHAAKFPTVVSNYQRDGKAIYWTPSIHMPRWASRLTLIVTATKIERLQDISEQDALAEGVAIEESLPRDVHRHYISLGDGEALSGWTARETFANLWDHLHGAGSWSSDPEVVALSFRVVKSNIDAIGGLSTKAEDAA